MTATQEELKLAAAKKAISYLKPEITLGLGSGSTVNLFIEELAKIKQKLNINKLVAASKASEELLQKHGFEILQANEVSYLDLYIDGADEANYHRELIKGGGAALTREKILASISKKFICIIDKSKLVPSLGKFPLTIEVVPFALSSVSKRIISLGGNPQLRNNVVTDNGNLLLDVKGLIITDPEKLEITLNNIPGVVTNGIFSLQRANLIIVAHQDHIEEI